MTLEEKLLHAKKNKNIQKLEIVFEEIYNEYSKLVGYIISKYVKNKEDIEELINDVFLKFVNAFLKNDINSIKCYLIILAKNETINFIKKKNRIQIVYDDEYIENSGEELGYNNGYYELIDEMKKILSEKEINIILLYSVYNYSFVEIAKKYTSPVTTINSIYHRAIKKFKKGMK